MAKLNWSTTNSQVTDELINVSGSTAFGLMHDVFYNKTGKLVEIWTGAGGTGTQLTETTDYTIGGSLTDGDLPSSITPDVAYTTVAITNAGYHSTDLYVNYYPLGDYVEAEDWTQLVLGTTLSDQDISSANATTDLTVYEPGGASALQDGSIVNVTWSGGDTTYYHKFTVTSSWTFCALGGPDLAPGDASATFAWCGYGDGALKLKLDIDNDRWIVLGGIGGGGIWDQGENSDGEWRLTINGDADCFGSLSKDNASTAVQTYNTPYQHHLDYNPRVVVSEVTTSALIAQVAGAAQNSYDVAMRAISTGATSSTVTTFRMISKGRWVSAY